MATTSLQSDTGKGHRRQALLPAATHVSAETAQRRQRRGPFTDQPSTSHTSASHTSGAEFTAKIVDASRNSSKYGFRFPDSVL